MYLREYSLTINNSNRFGEYQTSFTAQLSRVPGIVRGSGEITVETAVSTVEAHEHESLHFQCCTHDASRKLRQH